jgi:hypothetical protein
MSLSVAVSIPARWGWSRTRQPYPNEWGCSIPVVSDSTMQCDSTKVFTHVASKRSDQRSNVAQLVSLDRIPSHAADDLQDLHILWRVGVGEPKSLEQGTDNFRVGGEFVAKLDEDLWEGGIGEETNPWEDLLENGGHDFVTILCGNCGEEICALGGIENGGVGRGVTEEV